MWLCFVMHQKWCEVIGIVELSKINADIGCYYVSGEEDNDDTENILNLSNFINLEKQEQHLYKDSFKSK